MKQSTKQKLGKINNIATGVVFSLSLLVAGGELEDLSYWYIPFIGVAFMGLSVWLNGKVSRFIEQN